MTEPQGTDALTPTHQVSRDLDFLREQVRQIDADDRKAADFLDRVVLVGGPGVVVASMSFLRNVLELGAPGGPRSLLFGAWSALLSGALVALFSQYTTRSAARAYRRLLAGKIARRDPAISIDDWDTVRRPNQMTRVFNYVGMGLFLVGSLALGAFAVLNVSVVSQRPPAAQGAPTVLRADSSSLASLLRLCARSQCLVIGGYDYDLPRQPQPEKPATAPGAGRPR